MKHEPPVMNRQTSKGDGHMTARKPAKSLAEKISEADTRGGDLLARANEQAEKGNKDKAEALYAKGQYWLDRSNKLRGDA
jgi:hypothetical protein